MRFLSLYYFFCTAWTCGKRWCVIGTKASLSWDVCVWILGAVTKSLSLCLMSLFSSVNDNLFLSPPAFFIFWNIDISWKLKLIVVCCASQVFLPWKGELAAVMAVTTQSRLSAILCPSHFFNVVEQLIYYILWKLYFFFQLCTTVQRFYILTLQNLQTL